MEVFIMKVTVLGYHSPYPGPGQVGPGFLLEHQQKKFLIDAGSGVLATLQQFIDLNQLDGLFLSHYHHDHMSDFLVMQYAMQMQFKHQARSLPLQVYAPKEPVKMAEMIPYQHFIEPHFYNEESAFVIDDLTITFLQTDHPIQTYAIKFENQGKTFVYGADSGIGTSWIPFAENADLFILECSYLERDKPSVPSGHLSTTDVVNVSNMLRAKHLLLTHFYPAYDEVEIEKEVLDNGLKAKLHMPKTGKVVEV